MFGLGVSVEGRIREVGLVTDLAGEFAVAVFDFSSPLLLDVGGVGDVLWFVYLVSLVEVVLVVCLVSLFSHLRVVNE